MSHMSLRDLINYINKIPPGDMQISYLYAWTSCVHGAGQGRICLEASLLGWLPVLGLCLQSWGLDCVESPWEAAY